MVVCTALSCRWGSALSLRWRAGAAKGIGLACASCLGHEGCKVVVADVDDVFAAKCVAFRTLRLCQGRSSKASCVCSAAVPVLRQQRKARCRWACRCFGYQPTSSLCGFLPMFRDVKAMPTALCTEVQSQFRVFLVVSKAAWTICCLHIIAHHPSFGGAGCGRARAVQTLQMEGVRAMSAQRGANRSIAALSEA